MEIEIQSKTENPLLNRQEIHFLVQHNGEQTPKRELIRSELADKLKVKKDQIIVDHMNSHYGISTTIGYAKIYKSVKEAKNFEKDYLLKRNNALSGEKSKEEKPAEHKEETLTPSSDEQPKEESDNTASKEEKETP